MDQVAYMNEVKKCLKEANIFDEDLPEDKMIELYDAVKNSETSINLADKSLDFTLDEDISEDSQISDEKEPILDATKAIFGFNDMPPMQPCPLEVMYHPPQYTNILSSEKYLNSDSESRINMWYEYHVQLNKLQCDMARMGPTMAPSWRPVVEDKEESNDVLKEEYTPCDELYISRSGRQCKRKVYNETEDFDFEPASYVIKRLKDDDFVDKMESNNNVPEDEFERLKKSLKPQPKTYSERKLNNEAIMSRSSLFRDSDPQTPTKSTRRTSKILNAAKEQMEVTTQQEKADMLFIKSLSVDSDDYEISEDVVTERRIVPPPLPRRAKRGKPKVNPLNITTTPKSTTETVHNNVNGHDNFNHISGTVRRVGNGNSKPRAKKEDNRILCPLCSKSFPQKDIEDHASTCGEDGFSEPASKHQRITCEVCDAVVFMDTNYELHVRSCIAKQK